MALQLLQKGKDANANSDFSLACACFEAAYALSMRGGMLVSAANMRLKLGEPDTAAAMYKHVLTTDLLATEREMATRKLSEAQGLLGAGANDAAMASRTPPSRGGGARASKRKGTTRAAQDCRGDR